MRCDLRRLLRRAATMLTTPPLLLFLLLLLFLPEAFPSLSQTKYGGNKCALPPRSTGWSRLKIQFETARGRHPGAALQLHLATEEEAGPRRFRRRGRLFSVRSAAHTPFCDYENRHAAHFGVGEQVFFATGGRP